MLLFMSWLTSLVQLCRDPGSASMSQREGRAESCYRNNTNYFMHPKVFVLVRVPEKLYF